MRAGKAAWVAFGLSTALAGAAEAQEPPAQPGLAGVPIGAPATIRRPALRRAARRLPPRRTFGDDGSAAAAADVLGQSATPPALPPGTFDLGNGLSFLLNYTGQAVANPVGGIRQGSAYAGQLFFGIDADLQRLAGIAGGSVHVAVTNRHGRNLADDFIGNNTSVQEIFGGGQTTRLTLLSYQQKLFDNRLDIEVGRLVANINFLNSPIYCNFQTNSACGNPTFVFKTSNFTFWPVASWGGHAKAWLTDTVFFHVGAYEVNPLHQQPGDNGLDFSTKGATGAIVPFELGYSTTFANDALPRNYGIGGWVDRSDYTDPVLDAAGGRRVLTGFSPATRFGRSGIYARFDQMVWRPDPKGIQGLTLFGVAMAGTGGALGRGLLPGGRRAPDRHLRRAALRHGGLRHQHAGLQPAGARQHRGGASLPRPVPHDPEASDHDGAELRHPGFARGPADAEPAIHHQSGPDPLPVLPEEHPRRLGGRRQALGGPVHPGRPRPGSGQPVRGPERKSGAPTKGAPAEVTRGLRNESR
ncbi:porin [Methylobacterium sp. B4]|nr:porin [Methylobacterium sp. B4]